MQDIEDAVLVERCVNGQRDAFEALVARYWERLYVMIAHSKPVGLAAEDVVQEAFIQAYRKLATLRDPGRFAGWLYRIALRICRARRGGTTVPLSEAAARADDGSDPRASHEALDTRAHVRAAVASLPDLYRTVVTLRFFDGMSCEEVASHLGEPVGTVWTRLHRANRLLREKLGHLSPGAGGTGQ